MLSQLSLRVRLAVGSAIISLAAVATLAFVAEQFAAETIRTGVQRWIRDVAVQMRDSLDRGMFERYRDIKIVTALETFRSPAGETAERRQLLERLQETFPDYAWIGFASPEGDVKVSTGGLLEGVSVAQRPWFQQAQDGPAVADVHEAKLLASLLPNSSEEPLRFVDVAAPVRSPSGEALGVVGAHVSWGWAASIRDSLLSSVDEERLQLFVLDSEGEVLLGPDGSTGSDLAVPEPPSGVWSDGVSYIAAAARSEGYRDYPGLGWTIVVRQPADIALAPAARLRDWIALFGFGIAAIAILVGWAAAGRITAPLVKLRRAAESKEVSRTGIPTLGNYPEVAVLSSSLAGLVAQERRYREELTDLNQSLERRVDQRTADLSRANAALLSEMQERQRAEAERERLVLQLRELTLHDPLTGVLNRRGLDQAFERALARSRRFGEPLSILLADIDHFKRVNDTHGHAAGDAVLRAVSDRCKRELRDVDAIARLGGEEFVMLLSAVDEATARSVAERVRHAISREPVEVEDRPIHATASFGIAAVREGESRLDDALHRADTALYAAKAAGRNCVRIAA